MPGYLNLISKNCDEKETPYSISLLGFVFIFEKNPPFSAKNVCTRARNRLRCRKKSCRGEGENNEAAPLSRANPASTWDFVARMRAARRDAKSCNGRR